ncbi:MBL fold metallo-hydrolase [Sporanaerobium hydrogeniformans]|uniref:MBL fold metallo-hydrolase n=1 Tax=Sporanaerobium hydrogeniformans TaxID=3072179 RepID=A0AC61DGM7_9FIRM|nr:MBL fold metallo-hydrolase [Sporanaerobium hydrogeniformans]PHV71826.1 MBL fold metallo-hydrolase [Sporanaerobium hydrogeniformans]
MEFRLCAIASGSSGNCTFIQAGMRKILVDIGISGKKVTEGLQLIDIDPETIEGIFITHEHIDHIRGVGIFSRKYDTPIYATQKTWEKMLNEKMLGAVKEANIKILEKETYLQLEEFQIFPYGIYHDAVDPVGYIFEYQGKKITLATDIGVVDERIKTYLKGSNGILLEFNHDVNMLEAGSYPFYLKKRILSDVGHLNNEMAAQTLSEIYHAEMQWVVLGHLSKDNNVPDLAYLTAKQALEERNIRVGEDIIVSVAKRDTVSPIYKV